MGIPDGSAGTAGGDGAGPGLRADSSVDSLDNMLGPNAPDSILRKKKMKDMPPIIVPISSALVRDRYWRGFRALRPETY